MKFLGRVFHLVCLGLGFFWTGLSACLVIAASFWSESLMHSAHRLWARGCLWLVGIRVHFEGLDQLPAGRSVILAPNHSSLFDILVLGAMPYDFKWLSKDEVRRIPFVGWAMTRIGAFFVKRDRSGHDVNVLKGVEDGLRSGRSVVIFPEGTRTRTGELLTFKKGAFKTAQNSGAPLVPVAITGTYEIAPIGGFSNSRNLDVLVRFGAPIPLAVGEDLASAMKSFRTELEALLEANRQAARRPSGAGQRMGSGPQVSVV